MSHHTLAKALSWFISSLRAAAWAPIGVFSFHVLAILGFKIYARIPNFDIPMHFAGGVAIAYFFGGCYRTALMFDLLGQPAKVVYAVVVLGMTAFAAVVWEFAEFIADQALGTHTQPDLPDTLLDLLMGLLGGIAFLASHYRRWPPTGLPNR